MTNLQDGGVAYAPVLARPFSSTAPPGMLRLEGSGPLWRRLSNLIALDGYLRPRSAVLSLTDYQLTQYSAMESSPVLTESPLLIITAHAPGSTTPFSAANPPCGDIYSIPDEAPFCAVVTSRQAFVYNTTAGTWVNVTPTYTTGTITATNGSATITGAGTAWSTRGLSPYQFIQIDGAWYQVCSIASDTSATLTTNFTGATAAGKAYVWRRTWDLMPGGLLSNMSHVVGVAYNENLYFASRFLGRADGQLAPAVVRVQGIYDAAPTTAYLTARTQLTVGLDFISDLEDITGLAALQDGRVVITGNGSTVFWSSPTDQSVWTATPGGRTVVVHIEGAINALGSIGETLTLHYDHGVVLGYPTNQTEPPLSFRKSDATEGCFAPRTLHSDGTREFYVNRNGGVSVFDKARSAEIGGEIKGYLQTGVTVFQLRNYLWSVADHYRGHYHLFSGDSTTLTRLFTLEIGSGDWWPCTYPMLLTAGADINPFHARAQGFLVLGVSSNGGGSERVTGILAMMTDADAEDTLTTSGADATAYYAETDELDFGDPLQYSTLSRVWLWTRPWANGATTTIKVEGSVTGGETWAANHTKTVSISDSHEKPTQFSLLGNVPASGLLRVRITMTAPSYRLSRMAIQVTPGGDLDRVEL